MKGAFVRRNRDPVSWEGLEGASGRSVLAAVVDSGWNRSTADDRIEPGVSVTEVAGQGVRIKPGDVQDVIGHGTECTRYLLEIAPGARVIPIRVFDDRMETTVTRVAAAVDAAVRVGARVINLSMSTAHVGAIRTLYRSCALARNAGTIVVASAFNKWSESYPSSFEPVIGVADGDFEAPLEYAYLFGEAAEVLADGRGRGFWHGADVPWRGNSYSAARVAGVVCRMLEQYPTLGLDGIRRELEKCSSFGLPGDSDAEPL